MKIINIGKVPPPKGGVSVFIKRLKPYLDDSGLRNEFYDISGKDITRKNAEGIFAYSPMAAFTKIFIQEKACIFFHSNRLDVLVIAFLLKIRHKTGIFVHSESILKKNKIYRFFLSKLDYIVTPTIPIKTELLKQLPVLSDKIFCIPFVIFPKIIEDVKKEEIWNLKKKSTYLIVGYAYDLSFYNGEDLYGVDMMIDLVYKLRDSGIDVTMVILLLNHTNEDYYKFIINKIKDYNLEEFIFIMEEDLDEATSLFKLADVYVRPTNTDGNAFSIWESLFVNTPVVTSDVSQRPESCIVFKNRDVEDFYLKTKETIEALSEIKIALSKREIVGNENKLIDFFKRIEK